jgi:hypothetical protein
MFLIALINSFAVTATITHTVIMFFVNWTLLSTQLIGKLSSGIVGGKMKVCPFMSTEQAWQQPSIS